MNPLSSMPIDLAAIRRKLGKARGRQYWRSLEELAETPQFQELLRREFPENNSILGDEVGRRGFLKLMGASLALAGLTACTKQPIHKLVPYVRQPEEVVLGQPLYYASAMPHNGYALGILVKSCDGHPVKIEGNPEHPISLGASNVFMQAALLDLYDPDRAQAIVHGAEVNSWNRFSSAMVDAMLQQKKKHGAGLRILTETITSPTLTAQLRALLKAFPEARWHQYQPINRDWVYQGARLAFGEAVEMQHSFDRAEVIFSLGADFLFSHPASLRYARHYSDRRRVSAGLGTMNRLYVAEASSTITGAVAEHRCPLRPSQMEGAARAVAIKLGVLAGDLPAFPAEQIKWFSALASDLRRNRGKSIVIAGEGQAPIVHALAHAMNQRLGNVGETVSYTEPVEANPGGQVESLRQLATEMNSGRVELLLILSGNPVFTAPSEFQFSNQMSRVPLSVHLSVNMNETSSRCNWYIPETHFLETWSDARAFDGTVTIMQPLIAPLYQGISAHECVAGLTTLPAPSSYEVVRAHWQSRHLWPDFEAGWRKSLHDGVVEQTRLPVRQARLKTDAIASQRGERNPPGGTLEFEFCPDPCIWDGRYANNGWLQELPKPLNKVCWGNVAHVSPALAEERHLSNGELVELRLEGRSLRLPVWISPGTAPGSVILEIGNGRREVGRVGTGVGWDVYPLRSSKAMWNGRGLELIKTGEFDRIACAQLFHNVHSEERQILREATLVQYKKDPELVRRTVEQPAREDTLYVPHQHDYSGYKWAMSIDLTTCIGCNACVLACYAENNITLVGKEQVYKGRIMEWIRIDSYFEGSLDNPRARFVPMPCMHCENAPCELVCPVAATLHDHEGLNLQVYNRCVGTRFCSNNCPYKVRRFNFLQYQNYQTPQLKPMRNPQVTVRWRGVMEKCTYCVQRISLSRINAEKQGRPIADGELETACQQACPTRTIVFGDLHTAGSAVSKLREQPLTYSILGQLNTRPRTTYLAKLSNPNPELETEADNE